MENELTNPLEAFQSPYMKMAMEGFELSRRSADAQAKANWELKQAGRQQAALKMLWNTDTDRLDDVSAQALYETVTSGLSPVGRDTDGKLWLRKPSTNARDNLNQLRELFFQQKEDRLNNPLGDFDKKDFEAQYQEALENGSKAEAIRDDIEGRRGGSWFKALALSTAAGAQAEALMPVPKEINQALADEMQKLTHPESLSPEEQRKMKEEVIADYRKQIAAGSPIVTYNALVRDMSPQARDFVAMSYNTGKVDKEVFKTLSKEERDDALTTLSVMRGAKPSGRILGIKTDFTDNTAANRAQLALYGFQQSLISLITDPAELAGDLVQYGARGAWSLITQSDSFDKWCEERDLEEQIDQAMTQGLPEATTWGGMAVQGVAENLHWFVPGLGQVKLLGKAKAIKGALKTAHGLEEVVKPVREARAGVKLASGALKALTGGKDVGAKGLAEMTATVKRYEDALAKSRQTLQAAKETAAATIKGARQRAFWYSAGGNSLRTMMFSSFANEYLESANANGISIRYALPTAVCVGALNAWIENFHVPFMDDAGTVGQEGLKRLGWTALCESLSREAGTKAKGRCFASWLGEWAKATAKQGSVVYVEESMVEEPLQQLTIELGMFFDKRAEEFAKYGCTKEQFLRCVPTKEYFVHLWNVACDTVKEVSPTGVGFGLTAIPNAMLSRTVGNRHARKVHQKTYAEQKRLAEAQGLEVPTEVKNGYSQEARDPITGSLIQMGATNYDVGIAAALQNRIGKYKARMEYWEKEDPSASQAENNLRVLNEMTVARQIVREGGAAEDIAGVLKLDIREARTLKDLAEEDLKSAYYSPILTDLINTEFSLPDISEGTLSKLGAYVPGSLVVDADKGTSVASFNLNGHVKKIAFRSWSRELPKSRLKEMAKPDSEWGASFGQRNGIDWKTISQEERDAYVETAQLTTKGYATGEAAQIEIKAKDGSKVAVDVDDVIYLATGRLGNIGYKAWATQTDAYHEVFHSLWRFARELGLVDETAVKNIALTLGETSDADIDETMAIQFEKFANMGHVSVPVQTLLDKMVVLAKEAGAALGLTEGNVTDDYTLGKFYQEVMDGTFRADETTVSETTEEKPGLTPEEQAQHTKEAVVSQNELPVMNVPERFTVSTLTTGGGLTYVVSKDGVMTMYHPGSKTRVVTEKDPVTAAELAAADSSLNTVLELAGERIGKKARQGLYALYADIINKAVRYAGQGVGNIGTLEAIWKWAGASVFKSVKDNGDAQYSLSVDLTTICKKTEQLLNAVSRFMVEHERGATPAEMIRLYLETGKAGFQTPCPCCYVFSHWIRAGMLLQTAWSCQRHFAAELKTADELAKMSESDKKAYFKKWGQRLKKERAFASDNDARIKEAKETVDACYGEIDRLSMQIALEEKHRQNGQPFDQELIDVNMAKIAKFVKPMAKAFRLIARSDYAGWIKCNVIDFDKAGNEVRREDYNPVPAELLFDFTRADELVAHYPAMARFRTSKGSAGGKAIETDANNEFGEVISGLAQTEKNGEAYNPFAAGDKDGMKASFLKALVFSARQRLRGGQRLFSWSDNLVKFGPDMFMNFLQLEALGASVQSYSKQLEGVELIAAMGGYVNGSLMGRGRGYEECDASDPEAVKTDGGTYKLVFSDVQGINHSELFKLNRQYDRAGNILVGMNDTHIAIALGDDRIFFVIPWHASSLRAEFLEKMMAQLGEPTDVKSQDYTDVQGDAPVWNTKVSKTAKVYLKEGGLSEFWKSHASKLKGWELVQVEDGKVSESQLNYRAIRERIILGKATEADMAFAKKDLFLTQLVESLREAAKNLPPELQTKDTKTAPVKNGLLVMTGDDVESIYPYEYWDKSSTMKNADVNGTRYLEYCRRLGFAPKFSGMSKTGEKKSFGDFTGLKGYWKLLIDRRMYDLRGHYQHTEQVHAETMKMDYITKEGLEKRWAIRGDARRKSLITRTAEKGESVQRIVDAVKAYEDKFKIELGDDLKSSGEKLVSEYAEASKRLKADLKAFEKEEKTRAKEKSNRRYSAAAFPNIDTLTNDGLVTAAVAAKMAFERKGFEKNAIKNETINKALKRIHPELDDLQILKRAQEVAINAVPLADRMREQVEKGVSHSMVLQFLPEMMHNQFRRELRQGGKAGAKVGAYSQKVVQRLQEIERGKAGQDRTTVSALAVTAGVETDVLESEFKINLSKTLMHLADNALPGEAEVSSTEKPGVGKGEDTRTREEEVAAAEAPDEEIDEKARAAIDELIESTKTKKYKAYKLPDLETKKDTTSEDTTGEDGEGGGSAEEDLIKAVRGVGLSLQNPRHLAQLIAEMAWRHWEKDHALKGEKRWGTEISREFLRNTAKKIYTYLAQDMLYSASREFVMKRIHEKIPVIPTARGIVSEMSFIGQMIHERRVKETRKALVKKLEQFLKDNFGVQGRFDPSKEQIHRRVNAETEKFARIVREVMWWGVDHVEQRLFEIQSEIEKLNAEYGANDRDVAQSRGMHEAMMEFAALTAYGSLYNKSLSRIQEAMQEWQDILDGDSTMEQIAQREARTKAATDILAKAVNVPGLKYTKSDKGTAAYVKNYFTGHQDFLSLLRDLVAHAEGEVRKNALAILDYIALEVQKAGDHANLERRRQADLFHKVVESIYHRKFDDVMKDMFAEDERFDPFMGVVAGKRVPGTKARAMQLLVSLLQGATETDGYFENVVENGREGQADAIKALLSAEDITMLTWLGKWYETNRGGLSEVSKALFGVGIYSETHKYFPVKMLLDPKGLENGTVSTWSPFPKALTPRIRNLRDFDTRMDIFSMWADRMDEQAQWKAHAKLGIELRGIFGRSELQNAIVANHGAKANELLQGFITDILNGGATQDKTASGMLYFGNQIRAWASICALGGNVGVTLKQTTSIPAFGFELGMVKTARYITTAFTPNGLAAMKKIFASEQRRTRWQLGNSEAVANALSQNNVWAIRKLAQASMITNSLGDVVPALVVGQGIYRDALDRGLSEEDAMAWTWMLIERTQQSSRPENLTQAQRRSAWGRMFFQFLSTQRQYASYLISDAKNLAARPKDLDAWMKMGTNLALNFFILPSLYYWMGELWKMILGEEPSETQLDDWVIACLTGPLASLIVAGFTCKLTLAHVFNWMTGKNSYMADRNITILPMESFIKSSVYDTGSLIRNLMDSKTRSLDQFLEDGEKWLKARNAPFRDLSRIYHNYLEK